MKATVLKAPESSGRINWPMFEQHAGVEAIDWHIARAVAAREKADREIKRLVALRAHREAQIAAGIWPSRRPA